MNPSKVCTYPGCNKLVDRGRCEAHQLLNAAKKNAYYKNRDKTDIARKWLYSRRYRGAAAKFKQDHPFCVECYKQGIVKPGTILDHIIPHEGDEQLFWDVNNWQHLCNDCHEEKHKNDRWGRKWQATSEQGAK